MAATWAEGATQLKNCVKPRTDLEAHFSTQLTNEDTAIQSAEGTWMPSRVVGGVGAFRRRLSDAIAWGEHREDWVAWMFEGLIVAGQPGDDAPGRIHRYMHEQSFSFNSRGWTRGTPSAGSNTGTGTLRRLTSDWEGYTLQGGHVETKTFECIADQNFLADRGAERFRISGEDSGKDNLDFQGSGAYRRLLQAQHSGSGDGGSRLQNPSWDAAFNGSGTDKIPGWTIAGTASKITAGTSGYRTAPGASSQGTLVFENDGAATNSVEQALSLRRISVQDERTPWMVSVAYKKSSSGATGSLVITLGNKTTTLDLSTISDTDWHQLFFTVDKNVYYRNWKVDSPVVKFAVTNLSAGTLTLDDSCFNTWTLIDGTYWWLQGGQTAFLHRDSFTAADSGPTPSTSEMMYAAARAGVLPMGESPGLILNLPVHESGSETITDP